MMYMAPSAFKDDSEGITSRGRIAADLQHGTADLYNQTPVMDSSQINS